MVWLALCFVLLQFPRQGSKLQRHVRVVLSSSTCLQLLQAEGFRAISLEHVWELGKHLGQAMLTIAGKQELSTGVSSKCLLHFRIIWTGFNLSSGATADFFRRYEPLRSDGKNPSWDLQFPPGIASFAGTQAQPREPGTWDAIAPSPRHKL